MLIDVRKHLVVVSRPLCLAYKNDMSAMILSYHVLILQTL